MDLKRLFLIVVAAFLGTGFVTDAFASNHRRGGGQDNGGKASKKRQAQAPYSEYETKGLFATGLVPVFPDGLDCPPISSPYGSQTRYDGSRRNNGHHGYHNGMDITLETGTPLLSVADGEVIHKGTAGQLVGNYVWLRLAPEATGLPIYIFVRYQHLDEPSARNAGEKIVVGQSVGLAGNTGTTGGHFGSQGYPHLHLVFYTGSTPEYTVKGPMIGPLSLNYLDPVGLYLGGSLSAISNHMLRDLPDARKNVRVPVKMMSGKIVPEESKVVWPVACRE